MITLAVSQDVYGSNAQFTINVDGQRIGGVLTATSVHGSGHSDKIKVFGNWAAGRHTVTVDFLNDAWGGSAVTDRNLHVDGASFDGTAVGGAALALDVNGPRSFGFTDPGSTIIWGGTSALQPSVGSGDTLAITASTFVARGAQLAGVTVDLAGARSSVAGLSLSNGSVGKLELAPVSDADMGVSKYGALHVAGTVTINGRLDAGGRPVAPSFLTVTLGNAATLNLNGGQFADGSSLTINGAAGSVVSNAGILAAAASRGFAIHADLAGAGTIQSMPTAGSSGALIELDGAVAAAQTVRLDGGTLLLDQPMRFNGTVAGLITSSYGGPASMLQFERSIVTGASFQQLAANAGQLSVSMRDASTGIAGTAVIHVAGNFASNAFVFSNDAASQSALIRLAPL